MDNYIGQKQRIIPEGVEKSLIREIKFPRNFFPRRYNLNTTITIIYHINACHAPHISIYIQGMDEKVKSERKQMIRLGYPSWWKRVRVI